VSAEHTIDREVGSMSTYARQMFISVALMLMVAGVLAVGFVGCEYRQPSDPTISTDPPSLK
jgi:hypothetical protein